MDPSPAPASPRRAIPFPAVQLITGGWRNSDDLRTRVEAALRGGIRWMQLRAKDRSARELHEAACLLAPLLREAGALFVVNDRVDVALATGADGVHLPEDGMSARDARRLLGNSAWIARSVHSLDAAGRTWAGDLDAIQFGPVFDTASKREFGSPRGTIELALAAKAAGRVALIAVGGVSAPRASSCREAGAAAVAVIGAVWDAQDVEAAAREFARA
ncbi:MAG: thiamine phosphate synthase [Candidatus Binatia bacterium]